MFTVIDKSLLEATEDYICHQTNCVSDGPAAGLARIIFDAYPEVDIYKDRRFHDIPGTIKVRETEDGKKIVNMMGQFWPGSPSRIYQRGQEQRQKRITYFRKCLWQMCQELPRESSYAFPWGIGCGLAGGDWGKYIEDLKDFEMFINKRDRRANVVIYKLPKLVNK